ncbi:hypothetical protein [Labrys sp. WJW]|uniref:hypothetical protein n=1 Tax=Labrys sp. WJW TaxID=1737983 RepID=UPI0012EAA746|nr:hypothetical protein [Labrys sp. WJW]
MSEIPCLESNKKINISLDSSSENKPIERQDIDTIMNKLEEMEEKIAYLVSKVPGSFYDVAFPFHKRR